MDLMLGFIGIGILFFCVFAGLALIIKADS